MRHLEHASLARDGPERPFARAIGDVLAKHDDTWLASHLVLQRAVDRRDHGVRLSLRRRRGVERFRRRIDVGRVNVQCGRVPGRLGGRARPLGRARDLGFDIGRDGLQVRVGRQPLPLQERRKRGNRVPRRFFRALVGRLVQLFVIGQRMRVRPDDLGMDERRAFPLADVADRIPHHPIAGDRIGAVHAEHLEPRERLDDPRDVSARRLHLHGDGYRVPVVLDEIDDGQPPDAGRAQRLPELSFARRPFAERDVHDVILVIQPLTIRDRVVPLIEQRRIGAADRLQALRAGRARLRHDVEAFVPPVRRHLPAAGCRIVFRAHGGQEHFLRRHAEREAERAIAVVRVEPVVAGAQHLAGRDEHGLVTGTADLKEDQALVLELYLFVVEAPREQHRAIEPYQVLAREPFASRARRDLGFHGLQNYSPVRVHPRASAAIICGHFL